MDCSLAPWQRSFCQLCAEIKRTVIDNKIKLWKPFLLIMQMAPQSWLSAVCLYVQAAHSAASHCLWQFCFFFRPPSFSSTGTKYLQLLSIPVNTAAESSWSRVFFKLSVRQKHNKYWLFEEKRLLQTVGCTAIDCIKYWSEGLFHTKQAIIIEKGLMWTIIPCCRSVNKSMPRIL